MDEVNAKHPKFFQLDLDWKLRQVVDLCLFPFPVIFMKPVVYHLLHESYCNTVLFAPFAFRDSGRETGKLEILPQELQILLAYINLLCRVSCNVNDLFHHD